MKNKIICERAREMQKLAFVFPSERNKCRVKTPAPPGAYKYKYLYTRPPRPGLIPFILSLFLISIFWILPAIARADTIDVSGWAWSNMDDPATPEDERTIGWISFNNEHCAVDPAGCTCSSKGGEACPDPTRRLAPSTRSSKLYYWRA